MTVDRARADRLLRQGLAAAEVAAELRCTTRTILRIKHELGLPVQRNRPWTEDDQRRAQALFDDGCSAKEVARTLDRALCVVRGRFPGYRWSCSQGGKFGMTIRYMQDYEWV